MRYTPFFDFFLTLQMYQRATRHNHICSSWLRANSDMLNHSSSYLLMAHVTPLHNSI
jgi:hypothetical protein